MNVNWVLREDGEIYPEPFDSKKAEQFIIGNYKAVDDIAICEDKSTEFCAVKLTKSYAVPKSNDVVDNTVFIEKRTSKCSAAKKSCTDKLELISVYARCAVSSESIMGDWIALFLQLFATQNLLAYIICLMFLSIPMVIGASALMRDGNNIGLSMLLFCIFGICIGPLGYYIVYVLCGLELYGLKPNKEYYVIDFVNRRVEVAKPVKLFYLHSDPRYSMFVCKVHNMCCNICGYDLYSSKSDAQAVLRDALLVNENALKATNNELNNDYKFKGYYHELLSSYYNNRNTYGFGKGRKTIALLAPIMVNGIEFMPMNGAAAVDVFNAYKYNMRNRFKKSLLKNSE